MYFPGWAQSDGCRLKCYLILTSIKRYFLKKGWKWVIFFLLRPCQTLCMNVVSIIPTFRQILSVQTLSLWHTYCKKRLHKENFLESTSEEFLCIRTSGGDRQHSALPFCILSLMYSHAFRDTQHHMIWHPVTRGCEPFLLTQTVDVAMFLCSSHTHLL